MNITQNLKFLKIAFEMNLSLHQPFRLLKNNFQKKVNIFSCRYKSEDVLKILFCLYGMRKLGRCYNWIKGKIIIEQMFIE